MIGRPVVFDQNESVRHDVLTVRVHGVGPVDRPEVSALDFRSLFRRHFRFRRRPAPVVVDPPRQEVYEFDEAQQRSAEKQSGATSERHCERPTKTL